MAGLGVMRCCLPPRCLCADSVIVTGPAQRAALASSASFIDKAAGLGFCVIDCQRCGLAVLISARLRLGAVDDEGSSPLHPFFTCKYLDPAAFVLKVPGPAWYCPYKPDHRPTLIDTVSFRVRQSLEVLPWAF